MGDILDILQDRCPICGSTDVYRDSMDFLVCDKCGYKEVVSYEVCSMCGETVPKGMLDDRGLCPICSDRVDSS